MAIDVVVVFMMEVCADWKGITPQSASRSVRPGSAEVAGDDMSYQIQYRSICLSLC